MEREKRHILRLMETIEQNGQISQRELSKKLGISLGLVNLFIKRLAGDGYFEVTPCLPRRTGYSLTATGRAEKSRLAEEYLGYFLRFYSDVRKTIQKRLSELENEQIEKVIFYGAGAIAELIYLCLCQSSINLVGVIDKANEGGIFFGHRIHSPENILSLPRVPVFLATLEDCEEKAREIRENGGLDREVFTMEFSSPITHY